VMRSVERTGWDCPMPIPKPPADMLLDARVHDARHLRRLKEVVCCHFLFSVMNKDQDPVVKHVSGKGGEPFDRPASSPIGMPHSD